MKKTLLIIGGFLLIILLALAVLPFLFKDKIKAKVDAELAKSVNAKISYDIDKFSLSIFKNFPNITVSFGDFSLVAKQAEFKGDTLFAAEKMSFAANLMSIISGDKIEVKRIYLYRPLIVTLMAKNGTNSWSTLMVSTPGDTLQPEPTEPTEFKIAFEGWEIEDGKIIYDDASLPMYALLNHVNHSGSGDLTQEVVDVKTLTKSPDVLIVYDNVTYLSKHSLDADMTINMNYAKGEYKFLENQFKINNFKFGFNGSLAMPGKDISMDITFKALETEFKNLISLIPAVFLKDYDKIKTAGKVAFDGYVKGTMSDKTMPGYGLNLKINDAMMQYPDLPTAVTNILADISVDNKNGVTNDMIIDIKKFHMDMGKNPVDAKILVNGLSPYKIDANVIAKVNLSDITSMFPVDGTTLKGLFDLDVKAKGSYSDSLKLMPVVNAKMALQNGYVKTKQFPEALENISFSGSVTSPGQMSTTKVMIDQFNFLLDKEPFNLKAFVENLDNPAYDVTIKGLIDLTKMTRIYPLEGMALSGRINADIETKGIMSDVQAGKYDRTATRGTMDIRDFKYVSKDMPQGLSLSQANFSLTPDKMTIEQMNGFAGKSDINVKGYFSNYMGYMFGKQDTTIRGNMTLVSNKFDVNEWMSDEPAPEQPKSQQSSGIFEVPRNIDFLFASNIKTVLYDNMTLSDLRGNIIMKDGIVRMDNLAFNSLGGSFLVNGDYNTQDVHHPKFGMDMKMDKVQIPQAYQTFNSIQKLAPVAENMKGSFTLNMKMNGDLDKEMMPVYSTLSGAGQSIIQSATLTGNKALAGISQLTKLNGLDPMVLKDVLINFEIADGKLKVAPFDLNAGNIKMNIGGNNGLDGSLDYLIKADVPAGALGATVNGALSKLTGKAADNPQNIKLDFKVGGSTDNPKVSLAGSSAQEQTKTAVKDAVVNKAKEELQNNAEVQKAQAAVEQAKKEAEDKAKAEADRIAKETEDKAKKAAEDALKDKIKKKLPF
jgi:hypothetical protein